MHRLSTLALASILALAAPAVAASTDYLLKIKGIEGDSGKADKHKNQIEILSYSWGETRQADALTDGLLVVRYNHEPSAAVGKVNKVESIAIKQKTAADSAGDQRDYAKEPTSASGGVRVAVDDVNGDGGPSATPRKPSMPAKTISPKSLPGSGGSTVAHQRQKEIGPPPAAGAPAKPKTGSMEYLNRTRQKTLSSPAPAGSLNVVLAPGHGLCAAGKSLGTLTLAGSGGRTYTLTGVTIANCESESVSLNYAKIE